MNGNLSEIQTELVAIGAAVAAGCEPCLRTHVRQARAVGLTNAELRTAMAVARKVKDTPARLILEAGERLLAQGSESPAQPSEPGCCG